MEGLLVGTPQAALVEAKLDENAVNTNGEEKSHPGDASSIKGRVLEDPVEFEGKSEGASPERKKKKRSKNRQKRKDIEKIKSEPVFSAHSQSTLNESSSDNGSENVEDDVHASESDFSKAETSLLSPSLNEEEEREDVIEEQGEYKRRKKNPYVQKSVIIAATIVVEDGKLLMMQEAKSGCRGKWYIPAGRVELGESPLTGAEREVEEETGLIMEATGIFCVEYKPSRKLKSSGYNNWIRYGVTGNIVGGVLKTEDEADKESIQGRWVPLEEVESMDLRNTDFLRLLDEYQKGNLVPVVHSLKKEEY